MATGVHRIAAGDGAAIRPFASRLPQAEVRNLAFAFRIDNHPHLARAFGEAAAERAVESVIATLAELLGGEGWIVDEGSGLVSARLRESALPGADQAGDACARLIRSLSSIMASCPVVAEGASIHLSCSGSWSISKIPGEAIAAAEAWTKLGRIRFPGAAVADGEDWALRYRRDMAEAAALLDALGGGRVLLAWQPIRKTGADEDILYQECLPRMASSEGPCAFPAAAIPALERLGLVRLLDHYVVDHVIDELENDSEVVLGANISAHSAVFDGWWLDIAARLSRRPDIARRLVLEITETAWFPSIDDASAFAATMRNLGCRVAIDDFGAGHASIRRLLALKPDIIKIDGFFLRRAALSLQDRAAFEHIVGLASALAPVVVAEGIETQALSDLAAVSGAQWQQGYAAGSPSVMRVWLAAGGPRRVVAPERFRARVSLDAPVPGSGESPSSAPPSLRQLPHAGRRQNSASPPLGDAGQTIRDRKHAVMDDDDDRRFVPDRPSRWIPVVLIIAPLFYASLILAWWFW